MKKLIFVVTLFMMSAGETWAATVDLTVYRTPTCGCCGKWVDVMKSAGYKVTVKNMDKLDSVKTKHGIPKEMQSCHTGIIDGYVIEGHVPVQDVKSLLAKKPKVAGLAVPGMPIGSPGMEHGDRMDHYFVYSFTKGKKPQKFSEHNKSKK